jgi:hypothetical protein
LPDLSQPIAEETAVPANVDAKAITKAFLIKERLSHWNDEEEAIMKHKLSIVLTSTLLMMLIGIAPAVIAQDAGGAILGTVYHDLDGDGACIGTSEPAIEGIVVEFVNVESAIQTALATNEDGSFSYVSAGFGTWNISIRPPAGWIVTGEQSQQIALTPSQPVITNLDFCVTERAATVNVSAPIESAESSVAPTAVTLPESGAPVAPDLLIGGVMGIGFMLIGAGLIAYNRRSQSG